MPSKQVTIQGVMTWEDTPTYPSQGPGFPTHPIAPGGPGLGFWGGVAPPWVSHPIAPGGPPPQVWPGPGRPDQGLPPVLGIWPSPGYPSHPIAPGGPPPSIWPSPGRPDQGLPPVLGIWPSPGHPSHPIAPGGPPPQPSHPWVPPSGVPGQPIGGYPMPGGVFVLYWSPYYGWVLVPAEGPGTAPPSDLKPDQGLPETPEAK
jgi:hypothetical protein